MARSHNISHDEVPATSPLLNVFLLLAVGWMLLTAIVSSTADAGAAVAPQIVSE